MSSAWRSSPAAVRLASPPVWATPRLTVSAGLATTTGEPAMTPAELIARADEKLYQAKHEGRNRVVA